MKKAAGVSSKESRAPQRPVAPVPPFQRMGLLCRIIKGRADLNPSHVGRRCDKGGWVMFGPRWRRNQQKSAAIEGRCHLPEGSTTTSQPPTHHNTHSYTHHPQTGRSQSASRGTICPLQGARPAPQPTRTTADTAARFFEWVSKYAHSRLRPRWLRGCRLPRPTLQQLLSPRPHAHRSGVHLLSDCPHDFLTCDARVGRVQFNPQQP